MLSALNTSDITAVPVTSTAARVVASSPSVASTDVVSASCRYTPSRVSVTPSLTMVIVYGPPTRRPRAE